MFMFINLKSWELLGFDKTYELQYITDPLLALSLFLVLIAIQQRATRQVKFLLLGKTDIFSFASN
jgi:hypothetical protein